jgi:hypothetical protein
MVMVKKCKRDRPGPAVLECKIFWTVLGLRRVCPVLAQNLVGSGRAQSRLVSFCLSSRASGSGTIDHSRRPGAVLQLCLKAALPHCMAMLAVLMNEHSG